MNIVADVDGNDVVVYIRGINLIYADDGNKTYYHFNTHGDVVVLTNFNGSKTKSYSYNAFGVEYNEATLDENPFRYCGEYYDKETKTIYLRARYYNAAQGRFTQEDPIRDGYNWYVYCENNPIMFVDPSGLALKSNIAVYNDGAKASTDEQQDILTPSTTHSIESVDSIDPTGLLIAAGTSMIADGPLPIGDILAIGLIVAYITGCISYYTTTATYPSISFPEINLDLKLDAKTETEIGVDVAVDTKNKTVDQPELKTYYHVTTLESANQIITSQMLKGSSWEGGHVFAWETLPTPYAIENSGAHFGVIISFKTDALFIEDPGIVDPMVKASLPVMSVLPGPIKISDVMILGAYNG